MKKPASTRRFRKGPRARQGELRIQDRYVIGQEPITDQQLVVHAVDKYLFDICIDRPLVEWSRVVPEDSIYDVDVCHITGICDRGFPWSITVVPATNNPDELVVRELSRI